MIGMSEFISPCLRLSIRSTLCLVHEEKFSGKTQRMNTNLKYFDRPPFGFSIYRVGLSSDLKWMLDKYL